MKKHQGKPIVKASHLIREARLASGLSLSEVARRLGLCGPQAVIHYETGETETSLTRAAEILAAMGYELEIKIRKRA